MEQNRIGSTKRTLGSGHHPHYPREHITSWHRSPAVWCQGESYADAAPPSHGPFLSSPPLVRQSPNNSPLGTSGNEVARNHVLMLYIAR